MNILQELPIQYYKNGVKQVRANIPVCDGATVHYELMNSHYCKLSWRAAKPVALHLGDFIETSFGRFELTEKYKPTYDGLEYTCEPEFQAYYRKWKNKNCKYIPTTGASETSFTLTASIDKHARVILRNLGVLGARSKTFYFNPDYVPPTTLTDTTGQTTQYSATDFIAVFDSTVDIKKARNVSYQNISILDAIAAIAEAFECEWWVTENVIHFGECRLEQDSDIRFEIGVSAASMSNSTSTAEYATRLYAFGAEKNLPDTYKKDASADITQDGVVQKRLMLPTSSELTAYSKTSTEAKETVDKINSLLTENGFVLSDGGYLQVGDISEDEAVEGVLTNDDDYPRNIIKIGSDPEVYESEVDNDETAEEGDKTHRWFYRLHDLTLVDEDGNQTGKVEFLDEYILSGKTLHIIFQSGSLNGLDFEAQFNPHGLSEYLLDENGQYILDSNGNKQINPDAQCFEVVGNEDYGRFLPDDTLKPKKGDTFVLYNWDSMKMGNGTLITAASCELLLDTIEYLKESMIDANTYTCEMEGNYVFNKGNALFHDVGTSVTLVNPAYFADGERKSRIIGYEVKLDIPWDGLQYTVGEEPSYSKLGELSKEVSSLTYKGLAYTSTGNSSGGGTNIYLVKQNDKTAFSDTNTMSSLRELAEFVRLTGAQTVSGEKSFADEMHAVKGLTVAEKYGIDDNGAAILSTTTTEEIRNAATTLADRTLIGGTGYDMYVDSSGKSTLWVDILMVRVRAYFASLEIRKVSYSGGTTLFSNAGSTLCRVTAVTGGWKCYAYADDGTTRTMNWWKVGDQALCQTFNIKSGVYDNVSNRYYWRLVTEVGQEVLEDGRTYDYVVLSNEKSFSGTLEGKTGTFIGYDQSTTCDTPAMGDVIVQVGSQTDADGRGNVIKLATSSEEEGDAPCIKMYHGISSYAWTGLTAIISPKCVKFRTGFFEIFSSDDASDASPMIQYMGVWNANTSYTYYQQVTYDGQLWTWLNASKDSTAGVRPDASGSGWTLTVSKGSDGTSFTIKGSLSSTNDLPTNGNETGDAYIIDGYLWVYTGTTQSDATHVKGFENVGQIKGEDGTSVTVVGQSIMYATSASGTTPPASGWTDNVPNISSDKPYLWTRCIVTYSDGTSTTAYSVGYHGKDGNPGKDGTSVTILSTSTTYAITSTSTQPADSTFTYKTFPTVSVGDYLWSMTSVTYSDGTTTKTYAVSRIGDDGSTGVGTHFAYATSADGSENFSTTLFDGATYIGAYSDNKLTDSTDYRDYEWTKLKGNDGSSVTVKDVKIEYAISNSGKTAPTGEWSTTILEATDEKPYLWTRTTVTYSDNTTAISYSVGYRGKNGSAGSDAIALVLDNEMDSVPCDSDGYVTTDTTILVVAQIMKGATAVTASSWGAGTLGAVSPTQVTGRTGQKFLWAFTKGTQLTAERLTASISAIYNNNTYTAQFTLAVVKAGANGTSPSIYQLRPSMTVLAFQRSDDDSLTPSSYALICGYSKTTGTVTEVFDGTASSHVSGIDGKYNIFARLIGGNGTAGTWVDMSDLSSEGYTITVPSSITSCAIEFCLSSANNIASIADSNIIDRQRVPIVKDGAKGETGAGTDGWSVNINPSTVVIDDSDLTAGSAAFTCSKSATVTVLHGTTAARISSALLTSATNCAATVTANSASVAVKITTISRRAATATDDSGNTVTVTDASGNIVYLPYGTASVRLTVNATDGDEGKQFSVTVPITVAYTKYTGQFIYNDKVFRSSLSEVEETSDGLTKRMSTIEQTAESIKLQVEASQYRRNLLKGTAFKRAEDGWVWNDSTMPQELRVNGGDGGRNSVLIAGASGKYYGVAWKNIRLLKGKTYTLSLRYKVIKFTSSFYITAHLRYTNSSGTAETLAYINKTFTAVSDSWQTIEATTEELESDVEAELPIFASVGGQVLISGIILEEGDKALGWSLSEDDEDYIGGNLLDNTGTLTKGGNLADVVGTASSGTLTVDNSSGTSYKDALKWMGLSSSLEKGSDYMLSFEAKGSGSVTLYFYGASGTEVLTVETDGGAVNLSSADGSSTISLTSAWHRYWVHWHIGTSSALPERCQFRAMAGCSLQVRQPKLEKGATVTEWTAAKDTVEIPNDLYNALLPTGIDILNKTVTVTADNFTILNNDGTKTFGVDADGVATMNNILVGGLQWKQKQTITSLADAKAWLGAEKNSLSSQIETNISMKKLRGIYEFSGSISGASTSLPFLILMPEMYYDKAVGVSGANGQWEFSGGVTASEDDAMMLRQLSGNKVIVINKSSNYDINIVCWSAWWVDQYANISSEAKATAKASTNSGTQSSGTTIDYPWGTDKPYEQPNSGTYQMWVGREREVVSLTLKKGMMAVLECVAEIVGGYETVRWTGGVGYGWTGA